MVDLYDRVLGGLGGKLIVTSMQEVSVYFSQLGQEMFVGIRSAIFTEPEATIGTILTWPPGIFFQKYLVDLKIFWVTSDGGANIKHHPGAVMGSPWFSESVKQWNYNLHIKSLSVRQTVNHQYGFVWKCWVNIPNEIAI